MTLKNYRLTVGVAMAALMLLPVTSFAAGEIVTVKNYGDSMEFIPQVEAEDMILTVTGPCNYLIRRSLREHGELIYKLDETTIDGMYRFEVTAIPRIDGSIIEVLQDARKTGDNGKVDKLCREGALPGDPQIHTSGFLVDRAKIVYYEERTEDFANNVAADGVGSSLPFEKDTVLTNSDGTIRNSLCVGFDCLNNNTYADTTVLLRENNTRIKFDDTSSLAGFPNRDWEIEANSNVSGASSYFAVNDCGTNSPDGCASDRVFTLEANAPQHSLYVDSSGRIGNRTSNPVVEIHSVNGDTPTLRLQQDASSGFAPQTWDVAGNETNFFVRDVTSGSTLPFRIRPGAPSSAIFIDVDGDVGLGTSSPGEDFHLLRTDDAATNILFENTNAAAQNVNVRLENSAGSWDFRTNTGGNFAISKVGSGVFEFLINNATGAVSVDGSLSVGGDLNVTGTKNFAVPDPTDSKQWLYYSALEGPEAGTYYRGTGKLVEGEIVIDLPESFAKLTEEKGLTVQLTPLGGWHQLYVAEKSPTQLVVRDAQGGNDIEFDYFVQGVRKGYTDFEVERPAPEPVTVDAN